jgi:hypothetical protein
MFDIIVSKKSEFLIFRLGEMGCVPVCQALGYIVVRVKVSRRVWISIRYSPRLIYTYESSINAEYLSWC